MLRLLLIDDNEQDRALVIRQLKSEFSEIQIEQVATAEQFWQAVEVGNFEFVITDYSLRWSDGLAILHEIKFRYPDCPVIMFTGSGSQEIAVEAMKAGLDDYIIKSVKHYVRLPAAIRSILQRLEQQRITQTTLTEQAQLLDLVDEAIFVRNSNNTITYWNRSAEQLYGWTSAEVLGKMPHVLLKTQFLQTCLNIDQILHQQASWSGEVTQTRRDGTQIIVESRQVLMRDAKGQPKGVLEVNRNITERKQAEKQLLQSAFYDALTGLANRALFMERLKHAIAQTKRQENYLFAVLFLDLDRFKVINDSLGHIKGDQFLLVTANRLLKCIRATDTAARLGGDEFTILLDGIQDVSDAIKVAQRIQQELALPFDLGCQEVFTKNLTGA